jgi:hypothetical protein
MCLVLAGMVVNSNVIIQYSIHKQERKHSLSNHTVSKICFISNNYIRNINNYLIWSEGHFIYCQHFVSFVANTNVISQSSINTSSPTTCSKTWQESNTKPSTKQYVLLFQSACRQYPIICWNKTYFAHCVVR